MMASFYRLLALPRLPLLVLVLIFGAGLLPKNSMAQDEPASDAASAASPMADVASAGATTAGPHLTANASGRASGSGPSVKCYMTSCYSWLNQKTEDCLKAPHSGVRPHNCPAGYGCFKKADYVLVDGSTVLPNSERRCATLTDHRCLSKEPGTCVKYDFGSDKYFEFEKCIGNQTEPTHEKTGAGGKSQKEGRGVSEYCLCTTDLCNTGGKHLGYSVVLGGALLVSVFPLRMMFLVG